MKSQLESLRSKIVSGNYDDVINLFKQISFCYECIITPNGSIKLKDLNRMLYYDSEIVIQLGNLRRISSSDNKIIDLDYIRNLNELIKEREDFIKSIRV
jgi:threonine synthase